MGSARNTVNPVSELRFSHPHFLLVAANSFDGDTSTRAIAEGGDGRPNRAARAIPVSPMYEVFAV